jgi:hypothetical protein
LCSSCARNGGVPRGLCAAVGMLWSMAVLRAASLSSAVWSWSLKGFLGLSLSGSRADRLDAAQRELPLSGP